MDWMGELAKLKRLNGKWSQVFNFSNLKRACI